MGKYVKVKYREKVLARIEMANQHLRATAKVIETFYQYEEQYPVTVQGYINPDFLARIREHGRQISLSPTQLLDPFARPPSRPTLRYYATTNAFILFSVAPDKEADITQELALEYLRGNAELEPYTFDPTNGLAIPFQDTEHSRGDLWVAGHGTPKDESH